MSTTDTISSAPQHAARDSPTRDIKVSRVYIKATAEAIWTALTDPEWTNRYGYTGYTHYDLRPGGALQHRAERRVQGRGRGAGLPVPRRDRRRRGGRRRRPAPAGHHLADADGPDDGGRADDDDHLRDRGVRRLLLAHGRTRRTGAPAHRVDGPRRRRDRQGGGGGHDWILSDLKSLLETGSILAG